MLWALVVQGLILVIGLRAAHRIRSRAAALALCAGPLAIVLSAVAWASLDGVAGAALSGVLLQTAAGIAWRVSRRLYARADAMHDDRQARGHVETAAGALVASAAYDAAIGLLSVVLGFLLTS